MSSLRQMESVELYLSATDLPKLDITSNTDPFAVLYQIHDDHTKTLLKSTECIMDTLNPNWVTQILVNYVFENVQKFEVVVYDKDSGDISDLSKHQFCGSATFLLGALMCARGQVMDMKLENGRSGSHRLKVRAEAVTTCNDVFECSITGYKLANKDGFFGRSDPFLEFSRVTEDGSFVPVYKSEVVMNDLSPSWPKSVIPVQQLCNGDLDRPLKIEVFDWDSDGGHDSMGVVMTSTRQLMESAGTALDVIEEKKKGKRAYVNSGTLKVLNPTIINVPSFLDYIRGGCEVSLSVAIDFTGSNGHPSSLSSLHHVHRDTMNSYQQAILSVGSVLEAYDSDHRYPVYGFGAKMLEMGSTARVEHCFPLYGGGYEVQGVEGILQAYTEVIPRLKFSGPTLFAPLLEYGNDLIASKGGCTQSKQWYNVLLIITDGVITDMQNTIDNIVKGSFLPLSIIIVGVGDADFSGMRELDGDGGMLRAKSGEAAVRDIVQFVKFNDYRGRNSAAMLAKEVLAEVPAQVVKYMTLHNITANPPPPPYDAALSPSDLPPAYGAPP